MWDDRGWSEASSVFPSPFSPMDEWMDGIAFCLGFRCSYRIYAVRCPAITIVYSPDEANDDAISDSDDNNDAAAAAAAAAAENDGDDSDDNNTIMTAMLNSENVIINIYNVSRLTAVSLLLLHLQNRLSV